MRTVALISGGKDSCYNMMQCVAAGHSIVALANLKPSEKDELDSYMYQSVGHQAIDLYAEAMGLPLYRQTTRGVARDTTRDYTPTQDDEVEDLYELLKRVKGEMNVEAVSVGAIFSDYQRIRVENVCVRLGLVSLAYLWRRDQTELLDEMIDSGIEAILIKVAALGLDPRRHLGLTLSQARPHLLSLRDKYGLNVCGEGGEYETLTLDCPMFAKRLVVDEKELVLHSDDPVAPVGYLNVKLHLEGKAEGEGTARATRAPRDLLSDLDDSAYSDLSEEEGGESAVDGSTEDTDAVDLSDEEKKSLRRQASTNAPDALTQSGDACAETDATDGLTDHSSIHGNGHGWYFIGGVVGVGAESDVYTEDAMNRLSKLLSSEGVEFSDLCSVSLYVRDMADYATINRVYSARFRLPNPPTRVCVQCPLPPDVGLMMDAIAHKSVASEEGSETVQRCTTHVQSVSHWAPANIGPYSQAVTIGQTTLVCGQIPLIPGEMRLLEGCGRQSALALRHVARVLPRQDIRSVTQGTCYVTRAESVAGARRQLERRTAGAIAEYAVVSALPRASDVEWHVWAHTDNSRFHYEETGCSVGDYKVAICRRWNYENTVAAFVCSVSTGSAGRGGREMSAADVTEVLDYALGRVLGSDERASEPALSLRIFYVRGRSPSAQCLVGCGRRARASLTVVPVEALHPPSTFLSISGAMLAE